MSVAKKLPLPGCAEALLGNLYTPRVALSGLRPSPQHQRVHLKIRYCGMSAPIPLSLIRLFFRLMESPYAWRLILLLSVLLQDSPYHTVCLQKAPLALYTYTVISVHRGGGEVWLIPRRLQLYMYVVEGAGPPLLD